MFDQGKNKLKNAQAFIDNLDKTRRKYVTKT